jgi:glycosyltransferase involved in cell wall biosynthesis
VSGITVVIPSIPPRAALLKRAIDSVLAQTVQADLIIVEMDNDGDGAPATRDRALRKVTTEWVAFLDDDDELKSHHLETLLRCAEQEGADYVYSWYEIVDNFGVNRGDADWVLGNFGKPFDPAHPTQTTITTLVRTKIAQDVGFVFTHWQDVELIDGNRAGEDWMFTLGCLERGARIVHTPHRTWKWHHDSQNTSGRPWNRPEDWR